MARARKKKRTQTLGQNKNAAANGISKTNPSERIPKSMVIRMGASDVGPSISQLVNDMRTAMEPHTASRLKERRSNRLRDYTTMAGPLGVSHLLLFSRSASGNTNLRIAISPRGPTLSFRVENYSLCRDIVKSQRRPKTGGGGVEHLTPPLLVLNNFNSPSASASTRVPKHLENLTTSVFQSLFPPIAPQRTPLSSIRRVLLLNRETSSLKDSSGEEASYNLNLRHYAITTRPLVSLSRGLKRLRAAENHAATRTQKPQPSAKETNTSRKARNASLPNMGNLDDVADYVLDPSGAGYTSASETEADTDAEVEVLEPQVRKVLNRRDRAEIQKQKSGDNAETAAMEGDPAEDDDQEPQRERASAPVQKRAIRLTEIGPRMTLRLVKVEEGLCEGKVMWNEFVSKTAEEERALDETWERRKKEKEERKRLQRENLEAKRKARGDATGDDAGENAEDGWEDEFEDDLDEEMVDADDG